MPLLIQNPSIVHAVGNVPKVIEEYVGRVNTRTTTVSIAHMKSPAGWSEPGQRPEFDEYTLVLKGVLQVKTMNERFNVHPGQAVLARKGEWIQYSTPDPQGAEYISVCTPAFSPDLVHRDG
jgi:quercetin dioxygenase-like cupin family protein